ncbi:MAG: flagellar assembly protein FliW [Gemmatimonadaceae bacterium]|nr:flagellar assembly protein FliW [Gemmatimonadaceae bacterium]
MSAAMVSADVVLLDSVLLGPLEIRTDTVITFPAGLPGFVTLRRFALVETQRDDLVWLQSVDDAGLTFLLADPFALVPGFEVELPAADLAALGGADANQALLVLTVVQLDGGLPTAANLQSPVVIDRERRVGRQVVLPDSRYGMHHPIAIG